MLSNGHGNSILGFHRDSNSNSDLYRDHGTYLFNLISHNQPNEQFFDVDHANSIVAYFTNFAHNNIFVDLTSSSNHFITHTLPHQRQPPPPLSDQYSGLTGRSYPV